MDTKLEASVSRPAIGTGLIYLVQCPPALEDKNEYRMDNDHIEQRFTKLKQSDGSVVLDAAIPPGDAGPECDRKINDDRSLV